MRSLSIASKLLMLLLIAGVLGSVAAGAGERLAAVDKLNLIEVVRRLEGQSGFAILPRRWGVERFVAWANRNRLLATDFENSVASATAFLHAASVMLLVRRIAREA